MSDLRTILLLIGVAVIVAVYAWTRFQQQHRRSASRAPAAARAAASEPDSVAIEEELERMGRLVSGRELSGHEPEPEPEPESVQEAHDAGERLLVISVIAAEGERLAGDALLGAFENNKLRFSDKGIFERVVIHAGRERPVFGVANLVKPGTFPPPHQMARFSTPGMTLFLQLPAPVIAVDAFDDFVKTAERLAVEFGAELRDEHHKVLTHQALMYIREQIIGARYQPGTAS